MKIITKFFQTLVQDRFISFFFHLFFSRLAEMTNGDPTCRDKGICLKVELLENPELPKRLGSSLNYLKSG
jgi:hypothetical protein